MGYSLELCLGTGLLEVYCIWCVRFGLKFVSLSLLFDIRANTPSSEYDTALLYLCIIVGIGNKSRTSYKMPSKPRIGLIGLGAMGLGMAACLDRLVFQDLTPPTHAAQPVRVNAFGTKDLALH